MKKYLAICALAVVMAGAAYASDTDEDVLGQRTQRIVCENSSSFDPYVSVRGWVTITEQNGFGQAQGNLRVALVSSTNTANLSVQGQYVHNGRMEHLVLQTMNGQGVDEIYIDLQEGTFQARSYISLRSGRFYKMTCYRSNQGE
jgi:hypothetical protein